ncbi:hypothetical protein D3OALGA1CA_1785 [Olavius algarvensis associated proteobacterium Delta 3]|nr:hypothetical protein D3OALGA1CA_1785 [Olavius algarvensis associated proteobacterium Delta 3]
MNNSPLPPRRHLHITYRMEDNDGHLPLRETALCLCQNLSSGKAPVRFC